MALLSRSGVGLASLGCADCTAAEPSWAILNRGLLVCSECAGVHRSLGRHLSQLRSLKKGAWESSQLALVHSLHSNGANNIWEHGLHTSASRVTKPLPADPVYPVKAEFIRAKYHNLSFVLRPGPDGPLSLPDLNRQLWSCVRTNHVETSLRLLALGANPNYIETERGTSPLHVAAKEGQALQIELLFLYGADPAQPDYSGSIPADVATAEKHGEIALRLRQLQYETTDRLSLYLCGRRPSHQESQDFLIPELTASPTDLAPAKARLRQVNGPALEKLVGDLYDEVDRREVEAAWQSSLSPAQAQLHNERFLVPFLPVNPDFSATRNQSRQKLAKLGPRDFAALLISVLSEVRRRSGAPVIDVKGGGEGETGRKGVKSETSLPAASSEDDLDGEDYDEVAEYAIVKKVPKPSPSPLPFPVNGLSSRPDFDSNANKRPGGTNDDSGKAEIRRLEAQLSHSEQRLAEMASNQEALQRQLLTLTATVTSLVEENKRLKATPTLPQSSSNGSLSSNPPRQQPTIRIPPPPPAEEDVWQRRDDPSVRAPATRTPLSASTQFHSVSRGRPINGQREEAFPASVVGATERLTKQIQALLVEAQAGNCSSFPAHAASVQSTVDGLVGLVPEALREKRSSVDGALSQMVDHCLSLTVQCSKEPSPGRQEALSCLVVQAAYDVAKSAKTLIGLIQQTPDDEELPQ